MNLVEINLVPRHSIVMIAFVTKTPRSFESNLEKNIFKCLHQVQNETGYDFIISSFQLHIHLVTLYHFKMFHFSSNSFPHLQVR